MAEAHPYEERAVLYLLDRLSVDERRDFEARLAESAELRSLLRELEEGSVALAMSAPRRRPPAQIWNRIERTVAQERKRETGAPSLWLAWWRYGWAAAAVLLMGWLVHALWLSSPPSSSTADSPPLTQPPDAASTEVRRVAITHEEKNPASVVRKESDQTGLEIAGLRRQVAELSNHISQLSESVMQQQALLLETNRLKFFQLASASDSATESNAPLSPGLQRALFLAMARELGWLPVPGVSNFPGVHFVDFRTGSNVVTNPQPQIETQPLESESNLQASGNVPGFQSGTNAFLAFDSTVVGPGATLSFWSGADGQSYQLIGSSVMGNSPTIVTVPFSSGSGTTLTVTAGNGSGGSNIIGQFPPRPRGP